MGAGQRNIGQSFGPMHSNVTGSNVAVNAAPEFNVRMPARANAPTIPYVCISVKWAQWDFFRAQGRSPSQSASRPAARA